jgi:hypothetical protein
MNFLKNTLFRYYVTGILTLLLIFLVWIFTLFKWIDFLFYATEKQEEHTMSIVDTYATVWAYVIGNRKKVFFGWDIMQYDTICSNNTKVCLGSGIEWIKVEDGIIYTYFKGNFLSIDFNSQVRWKDYPILYSIWGDEHINTPERIEDVKQFWIFTQEGLNFYSFNELKKLPNDQQKILLDLKENPRYIFQ